VALFEDLWGEWLNTKLYLLTKSAPLLEKVYKGTFDSLSKEKQSELIVRKANFAKAAGIYLYFYFCRKIKQE
jgi:hypothetical protein